MEEAIATASQQGDGTCGRYLPETGCCMSHNLLDCQCLCLVGGVGHAWLKVGLCPAPPRVTHTLAELSVMDSWGGSAHLGPEWPSHWQGHLRGRHLKGSKDRA